MSARTVALSALGKLLASSVFVATSLVSCVGVSQTASALFYPEQTEFPGGLPPADFPVVQENPKPSAQEDRFRAMRWDRVDVGLNKTPERFRLSLKEYASSGGGDSWRFKIVEETVEHQVIELWYQNSSGLHVKYRVAGSRITPLLYKTDGGVGLMMLLLPLLLACLWLAWWVARAFYRWFGRVTSSGLP